jgi:hypothetical protein
MDWRREYASYLKGYAQARLGPYPDALRYDIEIAFNGDDDAAMFTIRGKIHDSSTRVIEVDGHYSYPQVELAEIVLTREQVEDNWGPRILDEKLPAWVQAWEDSRPGKPTPLATAIDAINEARRLPPHVRHPDPQGR